MLFLRSQCRPWHYENITRYGTLIARPKLWFDGKGLAFFTNVSLK